MSVPEQMTLPYPASRTPFDLLPAVSQDVNGTHPPQSHDFTELHDYSCTDALATVQLAYLWCLVQEPSLLGSAYQVTEPWASTSPAPLCPPPSYNPRPDWSDPANVRMRAKKKKKAANTWADEPEEKKPDEGGDAPAEGGGGGGDAGGGDAGGGAGAGGDGNGDNNGGGDDDWDSWNTSSKKKKKGKKGKQDEEEEQRKKEEEEAEAKRKEEEDAAATAAAAATASWDAVEANPDDEWGGFTAAGNKKKKKKGKVRDDLLSLRERERECNVYRNAESMTMCNLMGSRADLPLSRIRMRHRQPMPPRPLMISAPALTSSKM